MKASIIKVKPRFVSANFLANDCDGIVARRRDSGLNYVCYDVLRCRYPLIHNSEFLKDYGYHYADFSRDIGGKVLQDAVDRNDKELPVHQANRRELIARLTPTHPDDFDLHERLLFAPMVTL